MSTPSDTVWEGGISALLSLMDDVPVVHSGSSGGLYGMEVFDDWSEICPFYKEHTEEKRLRVLIENIPLMKRSHFAYIGKEDDSFDPFVNRAERELRTEEIPLLKIKRLPGDHFTSLKGAVSRYLSVTQSLKR